MAEGETVLNKTQFYLAISSFAVPSAVAGVLQLIQQWSPEAKAVVALLLSLSLIAITAFVFLPPCYSSICISISCFFAILTSDFVLSQFLPNILKWVPYLSCLLPLFDLLSLAWNAGSVYVHRTLDMVIRPFQAPHNASSATPLDSPEEPITFSSAASRMEEGNASTAAAAAAASNNNNQCS